MKRGNKYGARKTEVDGIRFDSAMEAARYQQLRLMERAGLISDLALQPRFVIIPAFTTATGKKVRKTEYVADFQYLDDAGRVVVEDVKGMKTREYRIKAKLFMREYPTLIFREITKDDF